MLSKGERLALALFFLSLALFIWGIKVSNAFLAYRVAQQVAKGIAVTLAFVEKNYPKSEPFVDIGFNIGENRDILHIDRLNNRITSERNFTYRYRGYTVKCAVEYNPNGGYYTITCQAQ